MAFWNAAGATDNNTDAMSAAEQQKFLQMLAAQAAGQGPSAAALMLEQNARQQAAQMAAQAAATRGVNPALAARNAELAGVQGIQNAGQTAAIERGREQLAGQAEGAQIATQARGQDIQKGLGYGGLNQANNQFNAGQNAGVAGGVVNALGSALPVLAPLGAGFLGLGGSGKNVDPNSSDVTTATGFTNETGEQYGPQQPSVGNGGLMGPPAAAQGGKVTKASVMPPKMAAGGPVADFYTPQFTQPAAPTTYIAPWLTPSAMAGQGYQEGRDYGWLGSGAAGPKVWNETAPGVQTTPLYTPGGQSLRSANQAVNPNAASGTGTPNHVMFSEGGPISLVGRHLAMAKGGKVPALVSPGERYLNKEEATEVAQGKKQAITAGEIIPGKAKVSGAKNSYANDTVSKTLEEGGVVLPRSVTQAPDKAKKADAFVKAVLSRKSK